MSIDLNKRTRLARLLIAQFAWVAMIASAGSPLAIAPPEPSQARSQPAPASDAPVAASDAASGRYGYKDRAGAWVISPTFKNAGDFSGGLAFVENVDGSVGVVDTQGAMVTPNVQQAIWASEPTLTEAKFAEGLLAVRDIESNKVGFVDAHGRWIIRPRFADAYEFHEGLAAFRLSERGKVGFIDKHGRVIIAAKFGTNFRSASHESRSAGKTRLHRSTWPLGDTRQIFVGPIVCRRHSSRHAGHTGNRDQKSASALACHWRLADSSPMNQGPGAAKHPAANDDHRDARWNERAQSPQGANCIKPLGAVGSIASG